MKTQLPRTATNVDYVRFDHILLETNKMSKINNQKTIQIHPAIDFTDDHAFVGQIINEGCKENRYIIRDDKTVIPVTESNLERAGLTLKQKNCAAYPKWSIESRLKFCQGTAEVLKKKQLFANIKDIFQSYIELPNEKLYDYLTLWTIGTYFFPLFNTYPYVYVGGISQTGKTKLLTLCSCLSFNGVPSTHMTTSILYRIIESSRCSLFIDEREDLRNKAKNGDFRNILLGGYKKGFPVFRNKKISDDYEPQSYDVYSPKMLANIEGLESVLNSRCLDIIMLRGSNPTVTNKEIILDDPAWQERRDNLFVFLMNSWKSIKNIYLEMNEETIINREWELWRPILSLAKFFENSLLTKMREYALETALERQGNNDIDLHEHLLVSTLLTIVDEDSFYNLSLLKDEFGKYFEYTHWLHERYIGKLLRKLGFNKRRRVGAGCQYFFSVKKVKDLAQILGIKPDSEDSELSVGTAEHQGENCLDHVEEM